MSSEHAEYVAWVQGLQAGDEVAIPSSWGPPRIVRIDRVTKTQVILYGGGRYSRSGRGVGQRVGIYSVGRIEPVTDSHREEIERAELVAWLDGIVELLNRRSVDGVSTAQLRAMRQAHDAAAPDEEIAPIS